VFCVVALLLVLVCCAERYRRHIITFGISLIALFSWLNSAFVYLPDEIRRAERENAAALAVSGHVYNSADAPPTYIIGNPDIAPILRFLNRNTVIYTAGSFDELPDDCFVITLAETGELIFTPMGEKAEAFALSQET
jgi:hypothetical protein